MEIIKTYTKVFISGTLEDFKLLLEKESDINAKDKFGFTLLITCINHNRMDILKYLIQKGAEPNLTGKEDSSPLHYAVMVKNYDIIKYLLQIDARIDAQNRYGNTPLSKAIDLYSGKKNEEDIIKLLLDSGANPNLPNFSGIPPLKSLEMPKNKAIIHLFEKWL